MDRLDELGVHGKDVAELAKQFSSMFENERELEITAMFHDIGKVLSEENRRAAILSASVFYAATLRVPEGYKHLVEAVYAQHGDLEPFDSILPSLKECLSKPEDVKKMVESYLKMYPGYRIPKLREREYEWAVSEHEKNVADMLYTRMVLSCLADADYCIANKEKGIDIFGCTERELDCDAAIKKLSAKVDITRAEIYRKCTSEGKKGGEQLYELKCNLLKASHLLSVLSFAVERCKKERKKRIFFVMPTRVMLNQSSEIVRDIIPETLVDHSTVNMTAEERLIASRWSAPVIMTTTAKFNALLFSSNANALKRLHNLSNSVIVYDDSFDIPAEYSESFIQAYQALINDYHCTFVQVTTIFSKNKEKKTTEWSAKKIVWEEERTNYRRKQAEWEIDPKMKLEDLAMSMSKERSVCTVLNLRKHTRACYKLLTQLVPEEEVYIISSDLCPAHQQEVLAVIKNRLEKNLPCRLITTSGKLYIGKYKFSKCFHALSTIERMRAASRLTYGNISIFDLDLEQRYPNSWMQAAAEVLKYHWRKFKIDIFNDEDVRDYLSSLAKMEFVQKNKTLETAILSKDFLSVDKILGGISKFKTGETFQILVPYEKELGRYERIKDAMDRNGGVLPAYLQKEAAPILVNVWYQEAKDIEKHGMHYDNKIGLVIPEPEKDSLILSE